MNKLPIESRRNLLKLANYLESLSPRYKHFDMEYFVDEAQGATTDRIAQYALKNGGVDKCHTVACAVGHGPAAGILMPRTLIEKPDTPWDRWAVDWDNYTIRFFLNKKDPDHMALFNWLFASEWQDVDNHHYGAAARIRYILAGRPLPKGWNRWTEPTTAHRRLYADLRKKLRPARVPA